MASPHAEENQTEDQDDFDFGTSDEQIEDEDTRDDTNAEVLSPSEMVDEFGNQLSSCELIDLLCISTFILFTFYCHI